MFYKKSEKGQALVLIALAAVGLFGFAALSIDGGMVFSDRRHAQNAADTAALAAALARVRAASNPDGAAVLAGQARAITNGYGDPNDPDSIVEVNICDETGIICEGLPAGADPNDYVRVKITSTVRLTFARIVGRQTLTNILTAVAKAEVGGLAPLFDGSALVALAPTGSDTVSGQGNVWLTINNSGVFDNSTSNCAMSEVGNITYWVETAYNVVGTHCPASNPNSSYTGPVQQGAQQVEYPPDIDIPTPSITCSGNAPAPTQDATPGHYTIHPGNYPSGLTINGGTYKFAGNGKFCFHGNVNVNGNAKVIANYADILLTSGSFTFNANSTFTCSYVLVHIDGGSGMHFNGNASNVCDGVTFFAETGSVTWNGNVSNTFKAPYESPTHPLGSYPEYQNVLIYMPYGNTSPLTINGNAGNQLTGSIIAVSSDVTISGNSGTTGLNSSITGYTITLAGNSNTTINYIPEDQYQQVDPSSLGLTK